MSEGHGHPLVILNDNKEEGDDKTSDEKYQDMQWG
jgi:hypothetical protein